MSYNTPPRGYPRVNILRFITYVNLEGDEQKTPVSLGRTLNISATGVGMEVCQQVSVGSIMEMEIALNQETLSVIGTVVHASELGEGMYSIGIQFDQTQPKLAALTAES